MKGRPKTKCNSNHPCIAHKSGKYLKWPCNVLYNPEERHKVFLSKKKVCDGCGDLCTKKYCQKCYYKFNNHYLKGKKLPKWWCKSISDGQGKGKESPNWKGEEVDYWTKHRGLVSQYGNPKICSSCKVKGKKNRGGRWTIQWANIGGNYTRDIQDYKGLCTKCHKIFDGKTKSIDNYSHGTIGKYRRGCRCDLCKKAKRLHRNGLIKYSDVVS